MGYLCTNFSIGLSVLDLGPMYATDRYTDRQTDVKYRQTYVRQTSDSIIA